MDSKNRPLAVSTTFGFVRYIAIGFAILALIGLILLLIGSGSYELIGVYYSGLSIFVSGLALAIIAFILTFQKIVVFEDEVYFATLFVKLVIPMNKISTYGRGFLWFIMVGSSSFGFPMSTLFFMNNRGIVVKAIGEAKERLVSKVQVEGSLPIEPSSPAAASPSGDESFVREAIDKIENLSVYRELNQIVEGYKEFKKEKEGK